MTPPRAQKTHAAGFPHVAGAWFLTGPTAAGKTQVAIEISRLARVAGQKIEIVSMDSMAVYTGMDISTAKPTRAERAIATHHLIDLVEPHDDFSLARYLAAAHAKVDEISARGSQPLFVGGTPLYLKALLRGLFQGPAADWRFRRELERVAAEHGGTWLWEELARVDSVTAAKLHANDFRRLIRAIEIFAKTERPMSDWQRQFDQPRSQDEVCVLALAWPREVLNERINRRVDRMFEEGMVDEFERLFAAPNPISQSASQVVGYRETGDFLAGRISRAQAIEQVKSRTRQFAKRQMTWFRSLSECRLIAMTEPFDAARLAQRLWPLYQASSKS